MYVNPDLKEMSQILSEDEMKEIVGVDAIRVESDKKKYLEEFRKQLKEIGYKEVKLD